jgi:cutinase-like protein
VSLVFLRDPAGPGEPPGVGEPGPAFIDTLRSRVGTESVGIYPVNYPATSDFRTALDGIHDAGARIEHTAATCPKTKMVLGGFPKVRP